MRTAKLEVPFLNPENFYTTYGSDSFCFHDISFIWFHCLGRHAAAVHHLRSQLFNQVGILFSLNYLISRSTIHFYFDLNSSEFYWAVATCLSCSFWSLYWVIKLKFYCNTGSAYSKIGLWSSKIDWLTDWVHFTPIIIFYCIYCYRRPEYRSKSKINQLCL